ncbi:MAG: hypothetical protein IKX47_06040 [Oscillospiraceae bacterium]|nr:hypothetical protein [Oscillospiraceae bacterium]
MRNCIRWQLRVLASAWWLLLLLPVLALLMGWAASAVPSAILRQGRELDARSAFAMALDMRSLFPLAGAVWASLFLGMDYSADAHALALSRGYSRRQIFCSKYLLYLLGCLAISLIEQIFALLAGVSDLHTLPGALLLRSFFLRLLLDLGMMVPPAFFCFLGKDNLYIRLIGLLYGVTLWRLMGSHYALWLQYAEWGKEEVLAFWPAVALVLGSIGSAIAGLEGEP